MTTRLRSWGFDVASRDGAPECPYHGPNAKSPRYGWICPKCGRGNAPYVATCPCGPTIRVASGTTV